MSNFLKHAQLKRHKGKRDWIAINKPSCKDTNSHTEYAMHFSFFFEFSFLFLFSIAFNFPENGKTKRLTYSICRICQSENENGCVNVTVFCRLFFMTGEFATSWKTNTIKSKINMCVVGQQRGSVSLSYHFLRYVPRFVTADCQKHFNSFLNTNDGCCTEFNLLHHWNERTTMKTINN